MGSLYVALPLDDQIREWLRGEGVAVENGGASRWPTSRELRAVLDSLPGSAVEYIAKPEGAWDAQVKDANLGWAGEQATLWVEPSASEDSPVEFSFHRPSPQMAITILQRLAAHCGPFAVTEASAMVPILVTAGCDPVETTRKWLELW